MTWFEALSQLLNICKTIYGHIEGVTSDNPDKQLAEAKKILKKHFKSTNANVKEIREKWEEIKKNADISTSEAYKKLIDFMDDVHKKSEEELDKQKSYIMTYSRKCIEAVDFRGSFKQYISQFEIVKSSLNEFHRFIMDEILGSLFKFISEVEKKEEESKSTPELNEGYLMQIASQMSGKLKEIQGKIKKYIEGKYKQALGLSGGSDANSIVEMFPCNAAYLRIMMSCAGIVSGEPKEKKEGKEYIKYFGPGLLAKCVYNAFMHIKKLIELKSK